MCLSYEVTLITPFVSIIIYLYEGAVLLEEGKASFPFFFLLHEGFECRVVFP